MISTDYIKDHTWIVIPAKNESGRIDKVLNKLQFNGYKNIVVVNDGSDDDTQLVIEQFKGVTLVNHMINLGPGASTLTGLKKAVELGAEVVVTMDADNQHNPDDIFGLVSHLIDNDYDIVIGSRFLKKNPIPFIRVWYNRIGNIISFFVSGLKLTDSQSGMKAIRGNIAKQMHLHHNGFEFCIEIIKNARYLNAKIGEFPIDVTYTKDTLSKGQSFISGLNMLLRLFNPF